MLHSVFNLFYEATLLILFTTKSIFHIILTGFHITLNTFHSPVLVHDGVRIQ